jgi:hypothetical protein
VDILTKPIASISFQDVVDFCTQRHAEHVSLDYKQQIENESLARTIAAMANTLGGVIIVGVVDDRRENKPVLPVVGMAFVPGLSDRIWDVMWGNITPPFPCEVQVCDPVADKTFIVIRIPQSNATPHAIHGNTEIHYRTGKGNQPEALASVDRIRWLLDRREQAAHFREELYLAAGQRLRNMLKMRNFSVGKGQFTVAYTPLYPRDQLVRQSDLAGIVDAVKVRLGSSIHFPNIGIQPLFVQNGVARFETDGVLNYTEVNVYGSLYTKLQLGWDRGSPGAPNWELHLSSILETVAASFQSMGAFYERVGYWGLIEIRLTLKEILGMRIVRLPLRNAVYLNGERTNDSDDRLQWRLEVPPTQLRDEDSRRALLLDISENIIRSFGYPVERERITQFFQDQGRW